VLISWAFHEPSGFRCCCAPLSTSVYLYCLLAAVAGCGGINDASFSPDGLKLAVACRDGSVRVLDWPGGTCLGGFQVGLVTLFALFASKADASIFPRCRMGVLTIASSACFSKWDGQHMTPVYHEATAIELSSFCTAAAGVRCFRFGISKLWCSVDCGAGHRLQLGTSSMLVFFNT
jgi:WD40 repeat protein